MALNRKYILTITPIDKEGIQIGDEIVITDPITIDFNVQRMPFAGQNGATIDIHNLSLDVRNKLFYDWWDINNIRAVSLEAGYENGKFDLIYRGRVKICTTKHVGTENITHIEALTGLQVFDNPISITVKEGENLNGFGGVGERIVDTIPNIERGSLNFKNYVFVRPVALVGNAISLIKKYTTTEEDVFIDNEKIYVLGSGETIDGSVLRLDDETGLIGLPEHQNRTVTVKCMFEPRIHIGQGIEIYSRIVPQFNGQYKVWGVSHSGTISGSKAGNVVTTVQMWIGQQVFGRFGGLSNVF